MKINYIKSDRNTCVKELSAAPTVTTATAPISSAPSIIPSSSVPRVASQEAVHTTPISVGDTPGGATPLPSPSTSNPWCSSQWPWSAPLGQNAAPPSWPGHPLPTLPMQNMWPGYPWMPPFPVMPMAAPTWHGPLPTV